MKSTREENFIRGKHHLKEEKGLCQGNLGKTVATSGDIIGKYERDEVKPAIEVASKIADARK